MCELDITTFIVEAGADNSFVTDENENAVQIAKGSGERCKSVYTYLKKTEAARAAQAQAARQEL
jgi:gas vesicle GvpC-like protein